MTSSPDSFRPWRPPSIDVSRSEHEPRTIEAARSRTAEDVTLEWSLPDLSRRLQGTPEDEAFALGLAEGRKDGEARAFARMAPALTALTQIVEELNATRARFEREREHNLNALAVAVAHQLVQRELKSDPALVTDLVGRALELVPIDQPIDVRLHPEDLSILRPAFETPSPAHAIQWCADPSLERGSFMIESPLRIVDGRTDTALRNLYEALESE